MSSLQADIEAKLAASMPDVEVLLAELLGDHTVRLFIDHPDGVTLALCEHVTLSLPEVRERYALEVSSPGTKRPLTKQSRSKSNCARLFTPTRMCGRAKSSAKRAKRCFRPLMV